jgi:hypothetical protein
VFLGPDFVFGPGRGSTSIACRGSNFQLGEVGGEMFVDLGRLACKASQRYPVLAGLDRSNNQSLVIWCEQFLGADPAGGSAAQNQLGVERSR